MLYVLHCTTVFKAEYHRTGVHTRTVVVKAYDVNVITTSIGIFEIQDEDTRRTVWLKVNFEDLRTVLL
jgi:hypothetical protein